MFESTFVSLIAILLGFGVLIVVHELGHFLVAKWVNIRCQQFAVGFGPAILAWRKGVGARSNSTNEAYHKKIREALKAQGKDPEQISERAFLETGDQLGLGETEYRLNYIPLGGYVKMLGQEDLDPNAQSDDPRAYNQKPIWARACVLSAGVVMNVIFGFLFFIIAFMIGVDFPSTQVGNVMPTMPAGQVHAEGYDNHPAYRGLRVGDRITHIDGEKVRDFMDMKLGIALAAEGAKVRVGVQRNGEKLTYVMAPRVPEGGDLPSIGIQPMSTATLQMILPTRGELTQAGLSEAMRVVTIEGKPAESYVDLYRALTAAQGRPVSVTFATANEKQDDAKQPKRVTVQLAAQPQMTRDTYGSDQAAAPANLLGFVPATQIAGFPDPEQNSTPAKDAGAKRGDLIASLGGRSWPTPRQVQQTIGQTYNNGQAVPVTVLRNGQLKSLGRIEPASGRLGIFLEPYMDEPIVGQTLAGSPAAALELTGGSRLEAVNGQRIENWADLQRTLAQVETQDATQPISVEVTYRLGMAGASAETSSIAITAQQVDHLHAAGWTMPQGLVFQRKFEPVQASNPIEAAALGATKTGEFVINTYFTLLRLIQGAISPEAVRGPVGIVDAGTKMAQRGVSYLLFFLGLISINLAVINFLPVPVLDGGHIVFLIIEKIKGAPPSPAVQNAALFAGLALIGCVFLLVTYNDIARLVTGG
jgi:regulator of sigma E protease